MFGIDPIVLVYGCGVATALILLDFANQLFFRKRARRTSINRRLKSLDAQNDTELVLIDLRKRRGLGAGGEGYGTGGSLKRLAVQSGILIGLPAFIATFAAAAAVLGGSIGFVTGNWFLAGAAGLATAVGLPLAVLSIKRTSRQSAFAAQLPDALDIVVRSLRAGHPISISLGLVAREMADPIGSEFGIVVDEITYGLSLERALSNLRFRVGHPDLSLFVTSVSIQSSTGGNLAEVLEKLSLIIRDRFKLGRKVRALSAEGKFSAIAISLAPWIILGVLHLIAPSFYGEIKDNPIVVPVLVGAFLWSLIGDFIMFKMVNFRF